MVTIFILEIFNDLNPQWMRLGETLIKCNPTYAMHTIWLFRIMMSVCHRIVSNTETGANSFMLLVLCINFTVSCTIVIWLRQARVEDMKVKINA